MKLGVCCPVWKETRYLPLVLEQMALCPGPQLLLWQDKPLYWLGTGPAPSGFASEVGKIAAQFPSVEVVKIEQAAHGDETEPFGGFLQLALAGFKQLNDRGVGRVLWLDTDWLFDLYDMQRLYAFLAEAPQQPPLFAVTARHYWRDFHHTMSTGDVTVARPSTSAGLLDHYEEKDMVRLNIMLYHAAYVWTDSEMYDKVHSWGHAPLFKERQFYEKEWLGRDDSLVKPQLADYCLPSSIVDRLNKYEALL